MKRILAADVPEGLDRIRSALGPEYELQFATSVSEASKMLADSTETPFDLVIAGMHVDGSRVFRLLEYIRSVDDFENIPFLPIQVLPSQTGLLDESVCEMLQILGACPIVALYDLSDEQADVSLRNATADAFHFPVKCNRLDKGCNPHIPPEQTTSS